MMSPHFWTACRVDPRQTEQIQTHLEQKMIFRLTREQIGITYGWNKRSSAMHLLAILFFVVAAGFALRVMTDILDEDGARMWAALMGRSPMRVQGMEDREAAGQVVPFRRVSPVQHPVELPLAA
jgi:hypothetical protein